MFWPYVAAFQGERCVGALEATTFPVEARPSCALIKLRPKWRAPMRILFTKFRLKRRVPTQIFTKFKLKRRVPMRVFHRVQA